MWAEVINSTISSQLHTFEDQVARSLERLPLATVTASAGLMGVEHLVLLTLLLALTLHGLGTDLLVVLLESSKILASLGELALLHTLTDVPVDEGTLGVHEIELVVHASEHLCDGGGVGDHAACALHLGEVTTRHDGRWLVVDAALEASWAPVDELDGALGLDGSDGSVDILRDDITAVHHAARHVLAVARIALGHHVGWLEARVGDLSDGEGLVVGLLSGDHWSVRGHHEVDARVWDQVGLELSHIDVECTIEPKGSGQGRDDLSLETVEVGVGWALNVEAATADVVESLVVKHDSDVGVLQEGVGREGSVVRLDDSGGHLRRWVDAEAELGLLAVVDGETLEEQSTEARAGTATDGVEHQEALEASALVCELTEAVQSEVDNLLADGVVAASVVVSSIFLAGDQLLRVVELAVGAGADLIDDSWLEVEVDATRHVLASAGLGEEGVEGVIATADGLVRRHLAIRLDTVLEAVELPTGVTGLATALADMDRDSFTHC